MKEIYLTKFGMPGIQLLKINGAIVWKELAKPRHKKSA
jgi:hypothetical protein